MALSPHETTIGQFWYPIIQSLENNYGKKSFIPTCSPIFKFSNRCLHPDFSFCVDNEFVDRRFINRINARIPTIIGEVAFYESLDHLLVKCQQCITELFVDIAIAIHLPKPTIIDGVLGVPNEIYLYILDEDDLNPEPIHVPFDQEFTFQLRTKSLQRKIRSDLRANFEHQSEFIDVTIMLKKDTIFTPETLPSYL